MAKEVTMGTFTLLWAPAIYVPMKLVVSSDPKRFYHTQFDRLQQLRDDTIRDNYLSGMRNSALYPDHSQELSKLIQVQRGGSDLLNRIFKTEGKFQRLSMRLQQLSNHGYEGHALPSDEEVMARIEEGAYAIGGSVVDMESRHNLVMAAEDSGIGYKIRRAIGPRRERD